MSARALTLTIDSALEHVSLVGGALRGILENEPGPRQDIPLVELAVCEAVNNSIIHGYAGRPGNPVTVTVSLDRGRLTITVADRGKGFETFPETMPAMPESADLERTPLGGWGLRIMGEVMDSVNWRARDGLNELVMSRTWGA